jgi:hypothetical protein
LSAEGFKLELRTMAFQIRRAAPPERRDCGERDAVAQREMTSDQRCLAAAGQQHAVGLAQRALRRHPHCGFGSASTSKRSGAARCSGTLAAALPAEKRT